MTGGFAIGTLIGFELNHLEKEIEHFQKKMDNARREVNDIDEALEHAIFGRGKLLFQRLEASQDYKTYTDMYNYIARRRNAYVELYKLLQPKEKE